MNLIKKRLRKFTVCLLYFFPAVTAAQSRLGLNEFKNNTNLGTNIDLIPTVANIINTLLGFLGVLAVILVIWGGFKWMTAAGEEQKINEAKKILSGGVVGLVIILLAYAITFFVVDNLLEATGFRES